MSSEGWKFLPSQRIGCHDLGGLETAYGPIDTSAHDYAHWELQIHGTLTLLLSKGIINVHQLRKGIEGMQPQAYAEASYYERWAVSLTTHLLESGVLSQSALDAKFGLGPEPLETAVQFVPGDHVRVRAENSQARWRKPHLRTPGYIFGMDGIIERFCGSFGDPMLGAFGSVESKQPLYRVRFQQRQVWPEYRGGEADTIDVEIYQNWLEKSETSANEAVVVPPPSYRDACPIRWDGSWIVVHEARTEAEKRAVAEERPPARFQPLAEALVASLLDQGLFTRQELTEVTEKISHSFGESAAGKGRQLIARAWVDPEFKSLLLRDWKAAALSMNMRMTEQGASTKLVVLENTDAVHNLVVCTLCSCWPSYLLGNPPAWYKSGNYRARAAREPRAVLEEFGLRLGYGVDVRVHDSTADMRYMVLPQRPRNTEGWSEESLAGLLSRDSMVGCGMPGSSDVASRL